MKKKLLAIMISACIALSMTVSASALNLYFDGAPLVTDVPAQIINNRTMVPIGHIFNALGAKVTWDGTTKTATGEKDGTKVVLQIDNSTAYVNDKAVTLDTPAMIVNDRTMVPAWFVSEAFGAKVYWDGSTSTVRIATQVYDVIRVIDGDTIVVNYNGKEEKVRMIGVDTPESVHPDSSKNTEAGASASEYTKKNLEGKHVELEFDVQQRDQYGRLLAYVWVVGKMYNKILLEDGIANLATYPPNVKYVDEFTAIVNARNPESSDSQVKPDDPNEGDPNIKDSGKYVGSLESDKYHLPGCRFAEKITAENEIWFDTEEEAVATGYKPCGVCNP